MKLIRLILLTLAVLPLGACALSGEAMQGRILEEGTNRPIPGAIVVVRWEGRVSSIVDSQGVCYHVESATTDEQGIYRTKKWRQANDFMVSFDHLEVDAYKPGYGFPDKLSRVKGVEYLAPFRGAREEGLRKIAGAAVACDSAGESKKNLLPLYRKLYADALPLAVTKEDKYILSNLFFKIEELELPYEEAEKRHIERHNAIYHEK